MANETDIISSIDDSFQIKIYGKKVNDIEISSSRSGNGQKLIIVKVFGTKVAGDCIKLPKPFYCFLPDKGIPPDACGDLGDSNEYLMWIVAKKDEFVKLSLETGIAEEMVKSDIQILMDVNAHFYFHDVNISGTKITGSLRAWLNFHQKLPWPAHDIDVTPIPDRDYPFSIDITPNLCYPIYSVGIATAEVCVYANPNRVCGSIRVDVPLPSPLPHYSHTFDIACVNF